MSEGVWLHQMVAEVTEAGAKKGEGAEAKVKI